ncbi:MAG TPA: TetR/AcrR family transcriptional regulator [Solirubrobacterales bacterium]|nr:TetR/AcrR family transcriptional regulator [Solirubrobacterales bacterium]
MGREGVRLPEPPKQLRGVEKRERLYAAALARFERHGVAETRVEDVIADAGVSWATFFRYFPRKEDVLIEAIARHFREQAVPLVERAVANRRTRVRKTIERLLLSLLTAEEMPQPLHNQAFIEVFSNPARFAAMVDNGHPAPLIDLIAELLDEGRRRGEVSPELDPGFAALTVTAGAMFPAVQAAAVGAEPAITIGPALDLLWSGIG